MKREEAHTIMENLQRIFTQYSFMFSDKLAEATGMAILALEKPPEIIRCKECEFQSYVTCEGINGGYNPNGFCSAAERKHEND